MARLSTVNTPAPLPDPTSINLSRMIERLQQTIINPDSTTEARLRASSLERGRVGYVRHHYFSAAPFADFLTEPRTCSIATSAAGARCDQYKSTGKEAGNTGRSITEEGDAAETKGKATRIERS